MIRRGGNARIPAVSGPIFPNSYNDLFEAILPNSDHPSRAGINGDLTAMPKEGRIVAGVQAEFDSSRISDSAAQFGNQGDIQSCAE